MLSVALFILWIVFNGQLTWELVAFGAVIAPLLSWFVTRYIAPGLTAKKQMGIVKRLPAYVQYVWLLVVEIVQANFAVMRMILTDRDVVVPKLATFQTALKTRPARVVLADCITLTPGTITVHMKKNQYLVHCLDESLEKGLADSAFERRLQQIEEGWRLEESP